MSLLHVSINAKDPERVAVFLASLLGGKAFPFPPFPESWIAFSDLDDGTAVEVYPLTHTLQAGTGQVSCEVGVPDNAPASFVHAAVGSPHPELKIIKAAEKEGWLARTCNRGPFRCVEVWLENRLLVEVLDPQMQQDYRNGMTMENWATMFGLDQPATRQQSDLR